MGNDDVICLSSDDETTPVQTPREKFKEAAGPVKSELEPSALRPVNLKRTGSVINESKPNEIKKPKVSSQVARQEVANSLPAGSTNQDSKSTSTAKKVNLTLPRYVRKSTVHEVYFRSKNGGFCKQKSPPGIAQSEATRSRSTGHSEPHKIKPGNPESRHSQLNFTKKNESSPSNGSKTLDDKKKTEKAVAKPTEKAMAPGEKTKTPVMDRIREEMSDLPNIRITPLGTSSKVSVAKHQEKTTSETAKLSEPNRRWSSDQNPRGQSTNNTPKSALTKSENLLKLVEEFGRLIEQGSPQVTVDQKIAQASSSPEIMIVEAPESSKIKSIGSDNKVNGKSDKFSNLSLRRPSSKEDNKVCQDLEHVSSSRKDPPGTAHKPGNPGGSKCNESFGRESSRSESIPKASRTSLESDKIDVSKKPARITPLQLIKPKSNEFNSKKSDVKNGRLSTSSESENDKISKKPFEPVAGCSKTPDVVLWAEPKKKKLKVSPDPSFMTTPWQQQEHDEPGEKPEPLGQHKSSPKPQLVVKTKKPASVEQDTFAMFLSMCLQAERSPEMEKIVAKLKRNYDQLDPVYSRSQMFSDFLNDIRDKISAKGRIYSYISRVADEMKFRRKKARASATEDKKGETNVPGTKETDEKVESSTELNDDHQNSHESRRLRQKIKTIEMAMKKCAKRIQQYEVAEVDLDADDNSNYIKMERYKCKMVELYTKLCEYTNAHPDAGRSYLRPKHLRVTQIPSIDEAINSFINSKLSYNRKKSNKSFLDGLIFPDYVDILECVAKVNEEQGLGLDKRRQQQLAKEAFTELGKKLQEARQRDYWDTFSENLDNSDDPAATDPTLAEKLLENKKIAEKNTAEIFEEYVRKQEQRNETDHESTNSGSGHEEDDDDEDDEQDEEKTTDRNGSDVELSDTEDPASSSENEKDKNSLKNPEPIPEAERELESPENDNGNADSEIKENNKKPVENSEKIEHRSPNRTEETSGDDKPMEIAVNDVEDGGEEVIEILEIVPEVEKSQEKMDEDSVGELGTAKKKQKDESLGREIKTDKACAEKDDDMRTFSDKAKDSSTVANGSVGIEAPEIEVNHAQTDTEEETIEPVIEQPKVLRIRSFAKPPSSWASSQQSNQEEPNLESSINAETIDLLDDEPENSASKVPTSPKILPEARPSSTTTMNAESQRKKKLFAEVSRILAETRLSVKTNRSTIVIRSPNKSSPNQQSKITKKNHNQEQSVQKKITIVRNLQSSIGKSESFKNRLTQDPSVQMAKAIAPIYKTSPRNGQFTQNRPQQSSVQKHIAVATSSKISPGKSPSEQTQQKQIPVASNRPQQSSLVRKQPATTQQNPRRIQSIQNLQQTSLSTRKPIATSRIPTTSHANTQSSQNRVQQKPPVLKLVETPKGGAATSHKNSSMPRTPKLSSVNSQILKNCLAQSEALKKLLSLAGTPKAAGAANVKTSPSVSHQTTTTAATITQKVRSPNTVHNVFSQDQLINLANRLVFPLNNPPSTETKSPRKVQNFSPEQLKAVKLVINNNEIRVNSNDKNNEKPRAMTKKLSSANIAQSSSELQAVSLATAKNPIRPGSLPAQRNLQTKPSNSQPLVKLRASPNPQILHSVQQQLMNVSKATIRPLGVPTIQAQGITLKNPRLIRLPGQPTMPGAGDTAARTLVYPAIQNRFQRPPQSANSTIPNRSVQGVNWRPTIHRTNCVLKPHTSNNTPPSPQQQHNFKGAAPKFIRPPQNNAPPNK